MSNKSYASVVSNIISTTKNMIGQMMPTKGHEDIMIKNSAGGYTYEISDEEMLDRILILGTNSNTYYSSAEKLTKDSIDFIKKLVSNGKGSLVVNKLKNIYETGRAPKQDTIFFILALITQSDMPLEVRKSGYNMVSNLRTFSQLYMWEGMRKQLSNKKGFGRAVREALYKLLNNKTGEQLAYQSTKYRSRKCGNESWSIDDIIKCAHVPSKNMSPESRLVISYLIKGMDEAEKKYTEYPDNPNSTKVMQYLRAVEVVKSDKCSSDTAVQLVREFNLPREALNTNLLNDVNVWKALLFTSTVNSTGVTRKVTMPITALIRNLGVMSQRGVFEDNEIATLVANHIMNPIVLKNGRVHPVAILLAKLTYEKGRGIKGKLTWTVNKEINEALEEAFYVAFGNVEGTGKRIMHAVDCSGSMTSPMCSLPYLSSCQAVSTLMMEAVRREYKYSLDNKTEYVQDVMLFNKSGTYVEIKPTHKLNEVMKLVQDWNFGATDCAQPMIKALNRYNLSDGKEGLYDLFVIYTDNETYYGHTHPFDALENYRKATGIDARMIVIGTTPTSNTIGYGGSKNILDSTVNKNNTPLSLNIAGFDLNTPVLVRNFALGGLSHVIEDDFVKIDKEDTADGMDEFVMIDE